MACVDTMPRFGQLGNNSEKAFWQFRGWSRIYEQHPTCLLSTARALCETTGLSAPVPPLDYENLVHVQRISLSYFRCEISVPVPGREGTSFPRGCWFWPGLMSRQRSLAS
jgi:hypothetical protein